MWTKVPEQDKLEVIKRIKKMAEDEIALDMKACLYALVQYLDNTLEEPDTEEDLTCDIQIPVFRAEMPTVKEFFKK